MPAPRPAKATDPLPETPPRGLLTFVDRLAPGWRHRIDYTRGVITLTGIDHTKPAGQKRYTYDAPGLSCFLRLGYARARAVAAWVRRDGTTSWKFDHAYTWTVCADPACQLAHTDHPDDIPRPIGARELAPWVEAQTWTDDEETAA